MGVFLLQYVLGQSGVMLMLVIIFMAVTSAGSAEMMAVSSLFTYDVWKVSTCLHMPVHSINKSSSGCKGRVLHVPNKVQVKTVSSTSPIFDTVPLNAARRLL